MKRLGLLVPLLSACSGDLPVYSLIQDLRVVAISAEPPTFDLDVTTTDVTFTALVVDPSGAALDVSWQFCPVESNDACRDYDSLYAQQTAIATAVASQAAPPGTTLDFGPVTAARALSASGTGQPGAADPALPGSEALQPYVVPSFTVAHDDLVGLEPFYEYGSFFGYGAGAWPSAVLTVASSAKSVISFKRVVVSLADLSAMNRTMWNARLGFEFCPKTVPEDTGTCRDWDPARAGNHNPVFAATQYSPGKSPLATWLDLPADGSPPLTLAPGAQIRLLPSFTPESFESYQTLGTSLSTNEIQVEEATEELSVGWFVTAGKVQDELTWPKFTRSLDTVYTAPKAPPAETNGLVRVWMVGQDQRGGTAWTHVDLLIKP